METLGVAIFYKYLLRFSSCSGKIILVQLCLDHRIVLYSEDKCIVSERSIREGPL